MIGLSALLSFVPLLSSCGILIPLVIGRILDDCHPRGVPFDEVALDGRYQGSIVDYPTEGERAPLELVVDPTYVDTDEYAISGTFIVANGEPLDMEGRVTGGCSYQYYPSNASGSELEGQRQPPPLQGLSAEVRSGAGEVEWSLGAGGIQYDGWIGPDELRGEIVHASTGDRYMFSVAKLPD
jgi:hypothetical protein